MRASREAATSSACRARDKGPPLSARNACAMETAALSHQLE